MSSSPVLFDSIGLAGYAVGKLQVNETTFHWMPRQEGDAPTKAVELSAVMRASWSTVGKICHVRLYCKNGDKLRFDGTSLRQKNVLRSCVSYRNSFHAHLTSNAPWSPPGFRSRDIEEQISPIFDRQDIDFVKEGVASGGGNYGTLDIDGKVILHPDSRCRRQLTTSPSCMMFFSQKIWAYCHSQRAINVSSKLTCQA